MTLHYHWITKRSEPLACREDAILLYLAHAFLQFTTLASIRSYSLLRYDSHLRMQMYPPMIIL